MAIKQTIFYPYFWYQCPDFFQQVQIPKSSADDVVHQDPFEACSLFGVVCLL